MKRLSEEDRIRFARVGRERGRRNALRRANAAKRRLERKFAIEADAARAAERRRYQIIAPKALSLSPDAMVATLDFFNEVRELALVEKRNVALDLLPCERLSPEVVPLLAAEMQRIRHVRGSAAVGGRSPKDPNARAILHATGFFDSMGFADPISHAEGDDQTSFFSIRSGTQLDGQITKTIANDFAEALGLAPDHAENFQKALNEALENISEHAYAEREKIRYPAEPGRWWICAMTFKAAGSAFLIACDLGATIPATIEDTARRLGASNLAALARFLDGPLESRDQRLLAAAFDDEVTRRLDGKGGRGLGKMAQLVQEFADGQLTVWSGGALGIVHTAEPQLRTKRLPRYFPGTYLLWNLHQPTAK